MSTSDQRVCHFLESIAYKSNNDAKNVKISKLKLRKEEVQTTLEKRRKKRENKFKRI